MADWPNITDAQCDPDAPVTSELIYGLRDAPIAIAEGAAGAPRIRAMSLGAVTAGGTVRTSVAGPVGGASGVSLKFFMAQRGSVRLSFVAQGDTSNPASVAVTPFGGASTVIASYPLSATVRVVDVPFNCGDEISVGVFVAPESGNAAYLTNVTLSTGGEFLWPSNFSVIWP